MKPAARITALLAAILLVTFGPVAGQEGKTPKEITLDNLQTAMNGEFTARARYRNFAKQAEKDGVGEVASLFRACARAEEIHAGHFMSLIQARGGMPISITDVSEVKATKDNLEQAWLLEDKERAHLYPQFAEAARAAGDAHAAKAFELITKAEAEHASLCKEAFDHLGEMTGDAKPYWVCRGCGHTTSIEPDGSCPLCGAPVSKMVEIN